MRRTLSKISQGAEGLSKMNRLGLRFTRQMPFLSPNQPCQSTEE